MYIGDFITLIKEALAHLYGHPLVAVLFTVFLVIATITDVSTLKIPNKLNLAFFLVRIALIPIMGFTIYDVAGALLAFFALLIPAMVKMHKMGGDIKCATVIGFYAGFVLTSVFLLLACLYFILYQIVRMALGTHVKMLPFAPFFLAANLTLMVVYYIFV